MESPGPDPLAGADLERPRPPGEGTWTLVVLFGALAFFQGLEEPTEGLPAQPVRSILKGWGRDASEIARFSALAASPWLFKPLFGLLSDFVPLAGTRRRGYLIASTAATALALLGLFAVPASPGAGAGLLVGLVVATAAVALSDVVADALMVERGRPEGLTGRLQAVQWASMYAAGVAGGLLGGELSQRHLERWAFLVCGVGATLSLAVAAAWAREPAGDRGRVPFREALGELGRAARSPLVVGVGGFLFLWNFNPFSNAVLHVHMTRGMGLSERFFGYTQSLAALASIAASLAYGGYCRRVPMRVLVHASIALGVLSTLAYTLVVGERTAVAVTVAVGFTYMTATLIQLDLAARHCPPEVAGTVFALLMALSNLAASLSVWLGGEIYQRGLDGWGSRSSFRVLVLVGSAFTASCWLLLPLLPRGVVHPGPDAPAADRR